MQEKKNLGQHSAILTSCLMECSERYSNMTKMGLERQIIEKVSNMKQGTHKGKRLSQ